MTKIIGLTGGIGSGKSTVAQYFQKLGIPVYIADDEAKKISESPPIIRLIRTEFGNDIFDGEILNRQKLAAVVFANPDRLRQLNSIIHPNVKDHFNLWVEKFSDCAFVIKEAAILFESGSYLDCDKIITVTAPLETRIERVVKRDQISREDVLKRVSNQWTDEQRIANSDFVIENDNLQHCKRQADEILKKLMI